MIWPYIRWGMYRLVLEHPCDLIVSVHQLVNNPMSRTLAAHNRPIPFTTVVTDMVSTHAAWFSNQADRIIVSTENAYRRGIELGISRERLHVVGQPVAERFCQPLGNCSEIRRRLGWPLERPVLLLVGGGEGMGPLEPTARAIDAARLPVTLVIIAGRNKKLKERLEKTAWNIPVKVYGFVEQMPDFMRAADILITKAGPGTISEAFIAGLPVILYSRLPGQEDGNVVYVVDHGAGVWAPRPDAVVEAARNYLDHPFRRKQAVEACLRLARPGASRQIARLLAEQVGICAPEEVTQ
jgi:1,2-diacylglycerol 3-beta-galactosyltransferase